MWIAIVMLITSAVISNKSIIKKYFNVDYINSEEFIFLSNLFSKLYSNNSITEKISSSIIDETTIDDKASKELENIRKKQKRFRRYPKIIRSKYTKFRI